MDGQRRDADEGPTLSHLITDQDVHAYIDGALPPVRRRAVEACLSRDGTLARAAAAHQRSNLALRAARDRIYDGDGALREEIERLMAKRAARRAGDGTLTARRATA